MKIFFQGDSITDAGRDRSDNHLLKGYPLIVKNALSKENEIVNYAISGDTTKMMLDRHEEEFKKENPDILIMLIGINDVWRNVDKTPNQMYTTKESVENVTSVIEISKKINPNIKVIVLEPYLLKGNASVAIHGFPLLNEMLKEYELNIKPLVDRYVYLQDEMTDLSNKGEELTGDGVHPIELGQAFLAKKVIEAIKSL